MPATVTLLGFLTVKLDAVIDVGSIARSNVAVIAESVATAVALATGDWATTVGAAGVLDAVVNVQLTSAPSVEPSEALTVPATEAV